MTLDVLSAALAWIEAGVSVIPIRPNGMKKPLIEWKQFQGRIASEQEVRAWFTDTDNGLAIICGAVSGGLEMLELEGRVLADEEAMRRLYTSIEQTAGLDIFAYLTDGYEEHTPSGGVHYLYYVIDGDVPGNTKIASKPAVSPEGKPLALTLAETRGEGGYVVVAPTGGACHPSGLPWTLINGEPGVVPSINVQWRDRIHAAIHNALDEMPVIPDPVMPTPARYDSDWQPSGDRPGDQWAAVTTWRDLLPLYGWQYSHTQAGSDFWTRPGKDRREGISASSREDENLYVWSSSTGLPTEVPLTKMYVRAYYDHGGDIGALAAQLRREGFGGDRKKDSFFDDYPKTLITPTTAADAQKPAIIRTSRLRLTAASQFEIKRVRWLWEGRAPIGEMTLIPGREGVGKSLLLAKLAAQLTRGELPGEFAGKPRPVLYVASEDSWYHTIAPRMCAAGADLTMIYRVDIDPLSGSAGAPMLPTDVDEIAELAKHIEAAALMLDPIVSLVDTGFDTYKAPELRRVLEPLRRAADAADFGILALVHFNKSAGGDISTRIAGSRAWTEVARAAIAVARMPQEETDEQGQFFGQRANRVVVSQIKNNLGRLDHPNLTYEIQSVGITASDGLEASVGRVQWGEHTEMTADQAMEATSKPPAGGKGGSAEKVLKFIASEMKRSGLGVSTKEITEYFTDELTAETIRYHLSRLTKDGKIERASRGLYRLVEGEQRS